MYTQNGEKYNLNISIYIFIFYKKKIKKNHSFITKINFLRFIIIKQHIRLEKNKKKTPQPIEILLNDKSKKRQEKNKTIFFALIPHNHIIN